MNEEEDNIHLLVEERDRFRDERDDLQTMVDVLTDQRDHLQDQLDAEVKARGDLQEIADEQYNQITDAIDILGGRRR